LTETSRVKRICQEISVIAHLIQAEAEEFVSFCQLVQIKRDLFGRFYCPPLSAVDGILGSPI
jgi:hypothetical protein